MSQNALAVKIKGVQAGLEARRKVYMQVLPKHVAPDKFIRSVLLACAKEPKLLSCSQESLFQAVGQACQLGLDPSGMLGSAYIIPYGATATLVPGYRGLIDLARRSGQIVSLQAHVVRKGDFFRYTLGDEPKIEHEPNLDLDDGAPITHAYAVARLKDGGVQREVMTAAEIERIRKKSKAGNSGPWKDHWEEMAKKTVIRRLVKLLPISVEILSQALQLDAQAEGEPSAEELLKAFEGTGNGGGDSGRGAALDAQLDAQEEPQDDTDRQPGEEAA